MDAKYKSKVKQMAVLIFILLDSKQKVWNPKGCFS